MPEYQSPSYDIRSTGMIEPNSPYLGGLGSSGGGPSFFSRFFGGGGDNGGGPASLSLQKPIDPFGPDYPTFSSDFFGNASQGAAAAQTVQAVEYDTGAANFLGGIANLTAGVLTAIGSGGDRDVEIVPVSQPGARQSSGGGITDDPLLMIGAVVAVGALAYVALK